MSWIYTPTEMLNHVCFPRCYVLLCCRPWFHNGLGIYCIHNQEAILSFLVYENKYAAIKSIFLIMSWKDNPNYQMLTLLLMFSLLFPFETESVFIFFWLFPTHLDRTSFSRHLLHKMLREPSILSLVLKNIFGCFPLVFVLFSGSSYG